MYNEHKLDEIYAKRDGGFKLNSTEVGHSLTYSLAFVLDKISPYKMITNVVTRKKKEGSKAHRGDVDGIIKQGSNVLMSAEIKNYPSGAYIKSTKRSYPPKHGQKVDNKDFYSRCIAPIIRGEVLFGRKAKHRILIMAGAKLTKKNFAELKKYNVKLVYSQRAFVLDDVDSDEVLFDLANQLLDILNSDESRGIWSSVMVGKTIFVLNYEKWDAPMLEYVIPDSTIIENGRKYAFKRDLQGLGFSVNIDVLGRFCLKNEVLDTKFVRYVND